MLHTPEPADLTKTIENKKFIDPTEQNWLEGPRDRGFELLFALKVLWEFL